MKLTRLILAAAITPASLAFAVGEPSGYTLKPTATLTNKECVGPCRCAYHEAIAPLSGSFTLTQQTPQNGGITNTEYAVTGVTLVAVLPDQKVTLSGFGTYSVGSTFPFQQRMILQLVADGSGSAQTYDSGLVPIDPGAGSTIDIKLVGNPWVCGEYDLHIIAAPDTAVCYANCDASTLKPVLNVADFTCFLQRVAAGDPWANCDGSMTEPTINVADFTCFLERFAAGCP